MWYLIYVVLWLVLLFIFPWIVSSILVILWFLFNLTSFPIELLSMYIYPVWWIVYIVLYIMFAYLIYEFAHHHIMNK